jgi:hypothetical protein
MQGKSADSLYIPSKTTDERFRTPLIGGSLFRSGSHEARTQGLLSDIK